MSAEAIAALCAKGVELAVEREGFLRHAEALAADIAAFDRAVAILDPAQAGAPEVSACSKRTKGASSLDGLYRKGEFQRDALEAIRTAAGPVSAQGIALDLAARKGLGLGSYAVRRGFEKRVSALLSGLKAREQAHTAGLEAQLGAFKETHPNSPLLADTGRRFKS